MGFSHKAYLKIGSHEGIDLLSLTQEGSELENCNFSLQQGIDDRGKASTQVYGGTLSLSLSCLPSQEIIDWGLKSHQYHKGAIIIFNEDNTTQERILFENAACISFDVEYTLQGKSYITTRLVLHAEQLIFGDGVDFDNNWTKYNS